MFPTLRRASPATTDVESARQWREAADRIDQVRLRIGDVVLDKDMVVRAMLAALLGDAHVLIEDTPGVGKTTLSKAVAIATGLASKRVQFTSDLLPMDILGSQIFDRETNSFVFHPGPVFTPVLLADEINRAGPRTQSALLEAMEERNVTLDGTPYPLPKPFLVIATQNPSDQLGTHPLPESQLDRFIFALSMGYPSEAAEIQMLLAEPASDRLLSLQPVLAPTELLQIAALAQRVHVSAVLAGYARRIAHATRDRARFRSGLSPRSLANLIKVARVWALMHGRGHVLPDDLRQLYPWVACHRVIPANEPGLEIGPRAALYHEQWLKDINPEV